MLKIAIEYKLEDEPDWHRLDVHPVDYFDIDESFTRDGVPRYDHAIDYLPYADSIKVTILAVLDTKTHESTTITETFWNKQRNRIIERVDSDLSGSEIIVESRISNDPVLTEVLRATKGDRAYTVLYHGLITDNPDGSQTEQKFEL